MVKAVLAAASTLTTQLVPTSRQPLCYCPTSGNGFSTGTDPPPSHGNMATEFHNLQDLRHTASLATKVFIQRDYSEGTVCKFQTKFPAELDSRIERTLFEDTIKTLNNYYAEAEKIGGHSYLEGCLACASAYIIFLCMETRYEKVLKKISTYIQEQNEKIYAPRGLLITDPIERGMRVKSPSLKTAALVAPAPVVVLRPAAVLGDWRSSTRVFTWLS
ncbi:golgin subfamily A member 7B isoform X2 [Pygocentrus nattereri]|uniref:golgin subfamily A member 7B isoform X2 n=1 Tax=Pygocentrus nattereri TaxID=42514 RepID=UPI0018918B41|nr:golgin subfamily A member 7B isoform X2 [Pygocentrus nattereri]